MLANGFRERKSSRQSLGAARCERPASQQTLGGAPGVPSSCAQSRLISDSGNQLPRRANTKWADATADPIARRPGIIRRSLGGVALKFVSRLIRPTIVTGMMAALIATADTYRGTAGVRDYLDADRGGMDRHPRLLRSVAAFTAPAEWPAAWSRYTTTGCAINSLSGKFAVGHNRRSERYPRDAANAIGGQSGAPVAESSFTGPEPTRIRTAASPSQMLLFGGVRDSSKTEI